MFSDFRKDAARTGSQRPQESETTFGWSVTICPSMGRIWDTLLGAMYTFVADAGAAAWATSMSSCTSSAPERLDVPPPISVLVTVGSMAGKQLSNFWISAFL